MRKALSAAALAATVLATTHAGAQDTVGWALTRLMPAPLPSDGLHGVRGMGLGPMRFAGAVATDFAHNPLVRTRAEDGIGVDRRDVVTAQLILTPAIAYGLVDRVTLNVAMPFAVHQTGAGYGIIEGRRRAAPGDLRFGVRFTALGEKPEDTLRLGLLVDVINETGSQASWMGDATTWARLVALFEVAPSPSTFFLTNLGLNARPERRALDMRSGMEISSVLSGGYATETMRTGLEIAAATGLSGTTFARKQTTPIETLVFGTLRFGAFYITLGAGPGLTQAAGTPVFRGVLRLGYQDTPAPPPPPPPPKVAKPDRDADGVDDENDACPEHKGEGSVDPKLNGCPDRDKDGVVDSDDACVDVAGVRTDDKKTNGCPPPPKKVVNDRDKDGIFDEDDACPDTPGDYYDDPKLNGCPAQ